MMTRSYLKHAWKTNIRKTNIHTFNYRWSYETMTKHLVYFDRCQAFAEIAVY